MTAETPAADEILTFRQHAQRAGLSESAAEHVIRLRHWTGGEELRLLDFEAVLAETPPPEESPPPEAPAAEPEPQSPPRRPRRRSKPAQDAEGA